MFIPKNERGEYELDPNEPPPAAWELERADFLLKIWERANGKESPREGCPHQDLPCVTRRECLGKVAWWRRYVREIEVEKR